MYASTKSVSSGSAVTVAIDLAKDVFELAFGNADFRIVERKRLSRAAFAGCLSNRAPLDVVMEACGSAHHWARVFVRVGHRVRLLPAQYARAYVHRNKTDRADAAGLLEAARCGAIRPVPIKSALQQGTQGLHRVREFHKAQRTAAINLARGLLREFGIAIPLGAAKVRPAVLAALEAADNELPMALRHALAAVLDEIQSCEKAMAAIEQALTEIARNNGHWRWPRRKATTRLPSRSPTRPHDDCGLPNTTARVSIPIMSAGEAPPDPIHITQATARSTVPSQHRHAHNPAAVASPQLIQARRSPNLPSR